MRPAVRVQPRGTHLLYVLTAVAAGWPVPAEGRPNSSGSTVSTFLSDGHPGRQRFAVRAHRAVRVLPAPSWRRAVAAGDGRLTRGPIQVPAGPGSACSTAWNGIRLAGSIPEPDITASCPPCAPVPCVARRSARDFDEAVALHESVEDPTDTSTRDPNADDSDALAGRARARACYATRAVVASRAATSTSCRQLAELPPPASHVPG